jgi:hypothetical protein
MLSALLTDRKARVEEASFTIPKRSVKPKMVNDGFASIYTTLDGLVDALIDKLREKGVIISKPAEGTKKKKIINIWFDEDTQEFVFEYE